MLLRTTPAAIADLDDQTYATLLDVLDEMSRNGR